MRHYQQVGAYETVRLIGCSSNSVVRIAAFFFSNGYLYNKISIKKEINGAMEMKQRWIILCLAAVLCISGCSRNREEENMGNISNNVPVQTETVQPTEEIAELTDGLSAVRFDGDYGFDSFLAQGGAASDRAVVTFLTENLLSGIELDWKDILFGCSTLSAPSTEGGMLFGRNFDWNQCNALIVSAKPENGYASISTVNMDFITSGT